MLPSWDFPPRFNSGYDFDARHRIKRKWCYQSEALLLVFSAKSSGPKEMCLEGSGITCRHSVRLPSELVHFSYAQLVQLCFRVQRVAKTGAFSVTFAFSFASNCKHSISIQRRGNTHNDHYGKLFSRDFCCGA